MLEIGSLVMFEEAWLFPGPWRVVGWEDVDGVILYDVSDGLETLYVSDFELVHISYINVWYCVGTSSV